MVLIFSKTIENTTNDVIDWIQHYGKTVIRIDKDNPIEQLTIVDARQISLTVNGQNITLDDIQSIWYRKGDAGSIASMSHPKDRKGALDSLLTASKQDEWKVIRTYFQFLLQTKHYLGDPFKKAPNKHITLFYAQKAGLNIPKFCISTNKEDLQNLSYSKITKANHEVVVIPHDYKKYCTFTTLIDQNTINNLPDHFFPALIQEKIEKQYEIRTFYLDGECYSMAIFSQTSEQTAVDFRVYNFSKPARSVPYQLPVEIEQKIDKLMKLLGLNTGSIDLIYSKDDHYVFLEVNPSGQFGMVSFPCNYYLEEKVAQSLTL